MVKPSLRRAKTHELSFEAEASSSKETKKEETKKKEEKKGIVANIAIEDFCTMISVFDAYIMSTLIESSNRSLAFYQAGNIQGL